MMRLLVEPDATGGCLAVYKGTYRRPAHEKHRAAAL